MASKRSLKKQIKMVCGDMAAESITASYIFQDVDKKKFNDCVVKTAELQSRALGRTNIAFDKTPKDFSNMAEYRKARRAYFSKAYKSLTDHFNSQVNEILHEMNSALKG